MCMYSSMFSETTLEMLEIRDFLSETLEIEKGQQSYMKCPAWAALMADPKSPLQTVVGA